MNNKMKTKIIVFIFLIVSILSLNFGCVDTDDIVETHLEETETVNFSTIEIETWQMLVYYRNDFPLGAAKFSGFGNISTTEYTKSEWEDFKQVNDESLKLYALDLINADEPEFLLDNVEFNISRHDIGLFENETIVQYFITVYNDEGYVEIEGEINYKRFISARD